MTIREGSLKAAADRLGITPAAVGQRIKALELFLGTDLLLRGRSGLMPTPGLDRAMEDLRTGFDALERVAEALDFQRIGEVHVVAEPDWVELWLLPRMQAFRAQHPNIRFCINGIGDVPVRLGSPDLRILCDDGPGEVLYRDVILPVTGPDNTRRIAGVDPVVQMEGMPLLHLKAQRDSKGHPGWVEWFARFGHRMTGPDRGVSYNNARLAMEAVRGNVGFLVCGLSLLLSDLDAGTAVLPFPASAHLAAPHPLRLWVRSDVAKRPHVRRFIVWLQGEVDETRRRIEGMSGASG